MFVWLIDLHKLIFHFLSNVKRFKNRLKLSERLYKFCIEFSCIVCIILYCIYRTVVYSINYIELYSIYYIILYRVNHIVSHSIDSFCIVYTSL